VARLIAENVSHKEHILRLKAKINAGNDQRIVNHVATTRSSLETKLAEMSALLQSLSGLPSTEMESTQGSGIWPPSRGKSPSVTRPLRAPMTEEYAEQNGLLPPIHEDYEFPRNGSIATQETYYREQGFPSVPTAPEDVEDVAFLEKDSPEMGSPPVSVFAYDMPVAIDFEAKTSPMKSLAQQDRRRRRQSFQPVISVDGSTVVDPDADVVSVSTVEVGNWHDSFAHGRSDFEPVRITSAVSKVLPDEIRNGIGKPQISAQIGMHDRKSTRTLSLPASARTALGNKTVNVDVKNSPIEIGRNILEQQHADGAKRKLSVSVGMSPGAGKMRGEWLKGQPPVVSNMAKHADMVSDRRGKSTAVAVAEQGSITPTAPEKREGESRFGRKSRASATKNYAEPNLRDKMRRPTKELVDAVCSKRAPRRDSVAPYVRRDTSAEEDATTKEEAKADDSWKAVDEKPVARQGLDREGDEVHTKPQRRESAMYTGRSDGALVAMPDVAVAAERLCRRASRKSTLPGDVSASDLEPPLPDATARKERPASRRSMV
jgi:hypothetical protein